MQLKAPVFIVGCPRSGTTWLYHLLLSAGGFAIYRAELQLFHHFAPAFGHLRTRHRRKKFLARWLSSEHFLRTGLSADSICREILDNCHSTVDCQRSIMEAIAAQQDAERWADCTPENLLYMQEIKREFPTALFVHIIRDGRDVALSLKRQKWIRPFPWDCNRTLVPAALYWEWLVARGHEEGKRLGTSYIEIRYEDLVQAPASTLSRLSDLIGHDLDYQRIRHSAIGSVSNPNTSFTRELKRGQLNPVQRWRTVCSRQEQILLESLIGCPLKRLGYPLETHDDQLPVRPLDRLNRQLYRTSFAARTLLKSRTPLGQLLSDTSLLDSMDAQKDEDKTLRPGLHRDFVRALVQRRRFGCSDSSSESA